VVPLKFLALVALYVIEQFALFFELFCCTCCVTQWPIHHIQWRYDIREVRSDSNVDSDSWQQYNSSRDGASNHWLRANLLSAMEQRSVSCFVLINTHKQK